MNTEIHKPEALSQLDVDVITLRKRAFSVSLLQIPPRSSSVPLNMLLGEGETHDFGFMTPNATVMHVGLNNSSKLDMDQVEVIRYHLKFATKQLDDRINFHTNSFLKDCYPDIASDRTLTLQIKERMKLHTLDGQLRTLKSQCFYSSYSSFTTGL